MEEVQEIKHKIEKIEQKFQKMGMRMGQNYGMRMGQNGGNYNRGGYNQGGNMGQAGGVFWGQNQNPMMGGQMPMGGEQWLDPRYM